VNFDATADARKSGPVRRALQDARPGLQDRASAAISPHPFPEYPQAPPAPRRAPWRADSERSERGRAGAVVALDTLAQPCHSEPGSNPVETLRKRARSKYISLPLAVALAELKSGIERSYRNTVYCNATLDQEDGKLRGRYCGNRWCLTCTRIRTARAMNRYPPELAGWPDKHFVTLTLPNVAADELAPTIERMLRAVASIARAVRRTDALPFRALRKLEVTHNHHANSYHPHFHLVVDGEAQARALVRRWLAAFPTARAVAQDVRVCDDGSARELFKYFTKLFTKASGRESGRPSGKGVQERRISVPALDVIFRAMRGRRVFQPMGFTAAAAAPDEESDIEPDVGTPATERPNERIAWEWSQPLHDWIDEATGALLTGYEPSPRYRDLVESISSTPNEAPYERTVSTTNAPADETRADQRHARGAAARDGGGDRGERARGDSSERRAPRDREVTPLRVARDDAPEADDVVHCHRSYDVPGVLPGRSSAPPSAFPSVLTPALTPAR